MDPTSPSSPTFRDPDLEAQISSTASGASRASSFRAADSHRPTPRRGSIEVEEEHSHPLPQDSDPAHDENSEKDAAGTPGNTAQPKSEWKPWKPDGPYRTKIPEHPSAMEDWVKAMDASDDGMCKGWREQIDNLVIFAGLFSATVTAFVIESYQWLDESPADMLARLQLRDLLNANQPQDPAIDRLAPATFTVKPASVAINALWFASLTIALAVVVISILCKQWLYEYQRYDNFTTEESVRIHGLRYRGLQTWRVPEIISSLPILLQIALVLFFIGLLVLLWPLQTAVASIITAIVGLIFLFLGITTILPAIQYIFPVFDTQCAYKSSQSWTFFLFTAFWLFDFSMFTNWAIFDQWEVTRIYSGTGHTLARVYELLSNSVDAFQSIYSFLASTSLNPTIKSDLLLLSDFIDGLDTSRRDYIISTTLYIVDPTRNLKEFQRLEQLKGYMSDCYSPGQRLTPASKCDWSLRNSFSQIDHQADGVDHKYHLQIQWTFCGFLRGDVHLNNPAIFNRYVEHWAQCIVDQSENMEEEQWWPNAYEWASFKDATDNACQAHIQWDPDIVMHLVRMLSCLLKADQLPMTGLGFLGQAYPGFVECHHQHNVNTSPVTLLKDVQEWINRMPESNLKAQYAEQVLIDVIYGKDSFRSHKLDLEKKYLTSFAQFFVEFFERDDIQNHSHHSSLVSQSLATLHAYLDQNPPISS